MRILCNILVVLFVTATAVGQQINPVPDYIFRNSMSVGRNAPTDTSAYFSIGPRFGATRGFMPPMVVDTAAVTGTKRNGLMIYSIQRNSFLYWDSTGMRWSRIAANLDTLLLSTRAWRQKGDDSLAAIINTRTDTVNLLSTKAWRQKGIDSVASVRVGGSGTLNYVPKFTASTTIGNSNIFDGANTVGIGSTAQSASTKLLVVGPVLIDTGTIAIKTNSTSQTATISTRRFSGSEGGNLFIGTGGQNLNSTSSRELTAVGIGALAAATSASFSDAFGNLALDKNTSGVANAAFGTYALRDNTTGSENTAVGASAISNSGTSSRNTAVGRSALLNVRRNNNVAIGYQAGGSVDSSENSIFIGSDARPLNNNNTNQIVIGFNRIGNGSNTTTIGNSSVVGTYIPAGESYFGTTTDAGDFRVQVSGAIYNTTGPNHLNVTSGNTGIGLAVANAPSEKLHVNGRVRIVTIDSSASPINMLWADVDGVVRKAPVPTASVSGGTTDFIPLWSSSTALTSSVIKQVSSEILVDYASDQGAFKLQVNGAVLADGGYRSGAPNGGTAATWKLGIVVAGSYTAASNYLQVDVGGTLYYIGLVTPN